MAAYTSEQLARALKRNGMPEQYIPMFVAIAWGESGGRTDVICDSCLGVSEYSVGPWQINLRAHPQVTEACAMDIDCAADFVVRLSNQGRNPNPWAVYTSGKWRRFIDQVTSALQSVDLSSVVATGPPPFVTDPMVRSSVESNWREAVRFWESDSGFRQRVSEHCDIDVGRFSGLSVMGLPLSLSASAIECVIGVAADHGADIDPAGASMSAINSAVSATIPGTDDLAGDFTSFLFRIGKTLAPYLFFLLTGFVLIYLGLRGLLGPQVKAAAGRAVAAVTTKGASELT